MANTLENPLCIKNERELGRATTNVGGKFHMVSMMDRTDYALTENQYYIDTYYTDPDGLKHSNVSKGGAKNLNMHLSRSCPERH